MRIAHMGSGSGSMLACVLGDQPVDFLRLIGIGYDEICWNEDWNESPKPEPDHETRNEAYRRWVEETFGVTIPETAVEIIPDPAEMGDQGTSDDWCLWLNSVTE